MPYPETLKAKPKCIFFTDFDGTITLKDSESLPSCFRMRTMLNRAPQTDNLGFGVQGRKDGNQDVLGGKATFRDSFKAMMDSVKTPYPECVRLLCENIKIDQHFSEFYKWSRENEVPVIVLSSGMTPILRAILERHVGPEAKDIEIVCNEAVDRPPKKMEEEGGWELKFHDDSDFGHDKSLTIRPYREHFDQRPDEPRPIMFYAGDGVSDLSAARETDLLFAKKGMDLISYCEREGVPFTVFEDWRSILATTKDIFEGKTAVKAVADESAAKAKKKN